MEYIIERKKIFDAYVADIMLKFSILQLLSFLFLDFFAIDFRATNIILAMEECIYLVFVIKIIIYFARIFLEFTQ